MSSKPPKDEGRIARYMRIAKTQWDSFLIFLYNPQEKTVMGRGGKSWFHIMIFYTIYYAFLAALFAIAISIVLGTLDPNLPRFQTRVQGPGLSIQPRQNSSIALTSDIMFTVGDPASYHAYTERLKDFFEPYLDQKNDTLFRDCDENDDVNMDVIGKTDPVKACRFNISSLGDCKYVNENTTYGYPEGRPCILVKVNRIINWFPISFRIPGDVGVDEVSKAPPLVEVIRSSGEPYQPNRMYVTCFGATEDDQRNLNGEVGVSRNTVVYPATGIPFMFYPYAGKNRSPGYLNPLVAVKFNNISSTEPIKVRCKVYSRNIQDDSRMQIGYYEFNLQVKVKARQ